VNDNGLIEIRPCDWSSIRGGSSSPELFTPLSEEWIVKWQNFFFQINGSGAPEEISQPSASS